VKGVGEQNANEDDIKFEWDESSLQVFVFRVQLLLNYFVENTIPDFLPF